MRASHNDLLSVQKRIVIEGWFVLVNVKDNAASMAAASSSQELVKILSLVLMVDWGYSSDNCVAPPFLVPPLADPSVQMVKSVWYEIINLRLHQRFRSMSSARQAIPGTGVEICPTQGVSSCHGDMEKVDGLTMLKFSW